VPYSGELAERPDEGEIQRSPHGLGAELRREHAIIGELGPIALHLLRQKAFEVPALVPARLVVDDPASSLGIDEAAVDDDIAQ
jgi:hypothetical protein